VDGAFQKKFDTVYLAGLIAQTLRLFCKGMKLCIEIAVRVPVIIATRDKRRPPLAWYILALQVFLKKGRSNHQLRSLTCTRRFSRASFPSLSNRFPSSFRFYSWTFTFASSIPKVNILGDVFILYCVKLNSNCSRGK